jgi:hypothetical protein
VAGELSRADQDDPDVQARIFALAADLTQESPADDEKSKS